MPETKTKKSASECSTARPSGTIKRGQASKHHILAKRITKNKRHLHDTEGAYETNLESVRAVMPYA